VDFFVYHHCSHRHPVKIAIECDGHDFHERTKDQARRDRSKDRWLLCNGYMVLRFTGSEIRRDPIGCAEQVRNLISSRSY
jgi:very-short-patch-repair endonuclease